MENYFWDTQNAHSNNTETLGDFLDNELDKVMDDRDLDIILTDYDASKNFCSVDIDGIPYEIMASGNGDFTHHQVEFTKIT